MPSIFRYTISICVAFFLCALVQAQEKKNAAPVKKITAPKIDYSPTGIRVGTDVISLVKTSSGKTFRGWELNGDIDFSKYYVAVDIGSWAKDITLGNGNYHNAGNYFRAGVDVNFLGKDPDRNMFFIGFRVGRSLFNESLTYQATSPLFTPALNSVNNSRVSGGWGEFTTGLRVKVWKGLWMGYTARMKFAPSTHGNDPNFLPYDMPGYGIVSNKIWWGFNYQVFWRFGWKQPKLPAVKK